MTKEQLTILAHDLDLMPEDLRPQASCTAWGMDVGDGWMDLLAEAFMLLAIRKPHCPNLKLAQVKEKFGTLRLYLDGADTKAFNIATWAEEMSGTICEACGRPGQTSTYRGWLETSCEEHRRR